MADWAQFEAAAPALAADGRRLIYSRGKGEAFVASVRGDDPPRINPVKVGIVDGKLYAFIIRRSAKFADMAQDGRYALHTYLDPAHPTEFGIRGHARLIEMPALREAIADQWYFEIDDGYALFEFSIDTALLGARQSAEDWPPRYSRWSSESGAVAGSTSAR
jgi:pyridoxamine 5'-phosphate oxidase-like protein